MADSKVNFGISQADMYQMYAYQNKYHSENVTLLYPLTEKVEQNKDIEFHANDGTNIRITIVKPTRSKAQTHEQQLQAKREELTTNLEQINAELNEVLQERANYDEFSAKGLEVTHKVFGVGVVVAHNGNLLNIRFGDQEKRFQMPQGFSNDFLKTDSTEIMDMFNEIAVLDDRISKLKSSQSTIKHQLETLK